MKDTLPLLSVRNLQLVIPTDEGTAKILDRVTFEVAEGEVVGLVGESGCGKSTLIKAILGILPNQAEIVSGEIKFGGLDLLGSATRRTWHAAKDIGFIPQDPFTALNPVFKVGVQMMEILRWSGLPGEPPGYIGGNTRQRHREHLIKMLKAVQIPDPEDAFERYPHQFSGGQRQRILIASALSSRPKLIVADEPTTALDVTTQREILILLRELIEDDKTSMLLVTHDFGVVAQMCDSVSVMYAGQTMENGTAKDIIHTPIHPYTKRLLACHPELSDEIVGIPGTVPSPIFAPPGCRFGPRCTSCRPACSEQRPPLMKPVGGQRDVACVLLDQGVRV
ncbi:ABC transporter ATP-binding protein [Aminobacter ciceronei]|uniref:Oligopeptide/dipeptide ABC transporter ATP-binding protein n=1 Tax=Aminobacter ciceronei TaxID=150723 RepID=A0ABR6CFA1_9HYPH|nr:ABC transporter ATP-binding protein [Aminobacter ciceronei]MBA8909947.1 oligopeptide/dipeptide ABC transporter ATP-binding protein [Aminobacter ciceronei]MBA9023719.1 oligopeptide/dipeptide ABC transporter ATP-binding protein [Aminobacter ciceronei]